MNENPADDSTDKIFPKTLEAGARRAPTPRPERCRLGAGGATARPRARPLLVNSARRPVPAPRALPAPPTPLPVLTRAQRSPEEGEGRPGRRHVPRRRPADTRSPRAGPRGAPGARRARRRLRSPSRSFFRSCSPRASCAFVHGQRAGSGSETLREAQTAARASGRRGGRGTAAGHGPGRARLRHSAAGLGPGPGRRGRVRRGHERGEGLGEGS